MALFTFIILLCATLSFHIAAAAPTPKRLHSINKAEGRTSGRYIIKLKDQAAKDTALRGPGSLKVTHDWKSSFFTGFAGEFDKDALDLFRANPDVLSISEDGVMHSMTVFTQTNAPWGLSRLSQDKPTGGNATSLDFRYSFGESAGSGVDIYIIDTGIRITHEQFQGRATWGATFGGYNDTDGNGHGTHCAGTAASRTYGVAKNANLIAVKVLGDDGSGFVSDIISGLDWVRDQAEASGRPSVASMSLGGSASTEIDEAVATLVASGVHVAVAAGNENQPTDNVSPARVATAITVGASTIDDTMAVFSNFGSAVDIFAPGLDVISSWADSDTAIETLSGTSMATPHVAGLIAYYISAHGDMSPYGMAWTLKRRAVANIITEINDKSTANLLARNDIW